MGVQSVFVGERFKNNDGLWFSVVEYITGKKIRIVFDKSGFETIVEGKQIRANNIEDRLTKYPQKGQRFTMKQNGILEVIDYISCDKVVVRFIETGFETTCEFCQIKRGTVKDLLLPRVCGVGFIGGDKYSTKSHPWAYLKWQNMLERCYEPTTDQMAKCYKGVTVCEEWFNFQVFAEWAVKQCGYGNKNWASEKDLLVKGNKLYSPDTCCFLPIELNNQMLKSEAARGLYPIGVYESKYNGRFIAHLSNYWEDSTSSHLGMFDTPEEAFYCYKNAKENYLKRLADKWKDKICPRAYNALMNYQVEITD